MSQTIHANIALLPEGWRQNVSVSVADGIITNVIADSNAPSADTRSTDAYSVDVLLPSPVNLHSHAFQRAMAGMTESRGPDPSDSFWTWRRLMYQFLDHLSPDDVESISALVQMEMLESGYSAVGEFHYLHHQSSGSHYSNIAEMADRVASAAEYTGIGLTLLPVLYEHGGCDGRPLGEGQRRFGCNIDDYQRLHEQSKQSIAHLPSDSTLGIAPHSLRAVSQSALVQATDIDHLCPFHIHVAEQPLEVQEVEQSWGRRPVDWVLNHHDVNDRWCLIHCTQMLESETLALAATGAVVGLCPITESSLGDGIFDGKRYLDAGGAIGVGSDSNIKISLSGEIRTLEYSQRLRDKARAVLATEQQSTARRIFDKILQGGSRACQRNSGVIAPNRLADLLSIQSQSPTLAGLTGDQLLDGFVFAADDRLVDDVWSAGRHLVKQGRHRHRDAIISRYMKTLQALQSKISTI